MSFRNYDRWLGDFEWDSDPSPPRRSSPSSNRRGRADSSPGPSRPIVGDDGWEVIPEDILKPENWGLPPGSLSSPPPHPETQDTNPNPGLTTSRFDTRRGQVVQFYPDHDPDLINTAQLDGLPYLLQSSSSLVPKVVKSAAYNASGGKKKPLPLSYKWEQGLLETAYEHPESLVNYSRISPGRRGGSKSFRDLRGDEEGGQGGMGSSGGTVPGPNFGQFGGGRGAAPASQPSTHSNQRFSSSGPEQPLSSGGGSGGSGQPLGRGAGRGLPTIHETPRTVGGGYSSNASSSRQAARQAAIRREAATKEQQMRNKAELAREEIMKGVRKREKAQASKEKRETEEKEAERVKMEKLKRDRAARDRKERDWVEKSKDVRGLAAEAAKRRDVATKDQQHQRAESLRKKREREDRETAERARERERKKREEEEEKYLMAEEKRERDREARDAETRDTEEKSKGARQLAREAAERRFKAMEREKQAEERAKSTPKPTPKPAPTKSSGLKAGPVKPTAKSAPAPAKPTPAPAKKVTLVATLKSKPTPTPVKTTLPTRPASSAHPAARVPPPPPPPPPPEESGEESKLTPQETVSRNMARREAAIKALPPPTPTSSDEELDRPLPKFTSTPVKPASKPAPTNVGPKVAPAKTAVKAALKPATSKADGKVVKPDPTPTFEDYQAERRMKAEEARVEKRKKSLEEQMEEVKKGGWSFGGEKK